MTTPTTPARRPSLIIRFADGSFAGSPLAVRTTNKQFAGTLTDPAEAEAAAKMLGGEVVPFNEA